ncbi:ATP-dependent DNA ligase [Intrasporangium chromatireducens Q5-1]|uniref:ATP-dependent DNA ligase n=1 Tax=Intrasporangium chromatireducens Q5-1 TaxID=584657 RepID=W9GJ20_9MICO|nr:non-homologous end-joining DNA ligase [Intrasporangium chromatireducens]EWT06241.1 ATP-dependent DNA ligase [Intrasporangium chromatireducens Q5-1]
MARADTAALLAPYRRKRDFTRTTEPAGGAAPTGDGRRRFVVQRHRARRLHYDLRFEIDGVLASWAVPKGPTLDPGAKRLAVHVEDHPMEYEFFEGVIPAGEYGGGDVIVWDRGTWEPVGADDPAAAVRAGDFHVETFGERLKGRFALVRRSSDQSGKEQWLLVHKHDEHAEEGWDAGDFTTSVLSGRTNDEVKAAPERLWRSDLPADQASVPTGEPLVEGPTEDELAALADLDGEGMWQVFGRSLKVSNLDKVLFPGRGDEEPVTKRELLAYAARIAPVLVPYLRDRALNMHRYPDGAQAKGFWHKEVPHHAPEWVTRWRNPEADADETQNYVVVDEPATLVWVAGFGALEWHPWTSPASTPDEPSYVLFDLDPGDHTTWDELLALARLHRTAFEHLHLRAYPKVTGRRGIQIWVPIAPGPTFEETRAWAERVSKTVGAVMPDAVSWKWVKSDRKGRARLDYTQNAVNKTLVAPYSPRPSAGAPVSAPILWDELDDPDLRPDRWTIRTILDRLEERGDLFRGVLARDQQLPMLR